MALPPEYSDWVTRQKQKLDDIERQVEYIDKIVSDLHYYGTSVDSEPSATDMHELLVDILKATDIPLDVEVSIVQEQGLPKMLVNPSIMGRVLSNLMINAVQAMPNGGKLTARLYRRKDDIYISIEDTGVGIPQENLDKIFQPLFTTKPKGQGLGLAVCKRLVESQGGSISFESQEGKDPYLQLESQSEKHPVGRANVSRLVIYSTSHRL
ncbi:MAG: sensor histidine kinase [Nitrososphaeria archaeon]